MALITMSLMSDSLKRTVPVNVILPADKLTPPWLPKEEQKPFKTLYLLHGILGNYTDWITGTRIARWAEDHDMAVVMPSGDNAFYVDQPAMGNMYGEFVGKELVELTRKMFRLSEKREDTFIGGLSMGGYGAMRNGLKYSETFGYIVALSSAFFVEDFPKRTNDAPIFFERKDYAESVFGDLSRIIESDKYPKFLIKELLKAGKEIPKIYMACGEDDMLINNNKEMFEFLKANHVDAEFEIGPGSHEWDFWDAYIKKAIDWLPVEKKTYSWDSGHVL